MDATTRPNSLGPMGRLVLIAGFAIASLAACVPGSGLPVQPPGTSGTATSEATPSPTPAATSSTGGSVVPVITF